SLGFKPYVDNRGPEYKADVFITRISPPDEHGYCSFGAGLWDHRRWAQTARAVIAIHDPTFIRTYGTNYIHMSEIDRSVEYNPPEITLDEAKAMIEAVSDHEVRSAILRYLPHMSGVERQQWVPYMCEIGLSEVRGLGRDSSWGDPPEDARPFAGYISELVPNGSTIQIGIGSPGRYLPALGAFDGKKDLGWHSEMAVPGVLKLVENGTINGSRKTIHRDKAIGTSVNGSSPEEIEWAHNNPLLELYDAEYVVNIRTAAAHENYISMNNAITVDLSGQINTETVGNRLWNGTGGQTELHMGAVLSEGGRAITLLKSTAAGGTVSRIVPQLPEGGIVTIPRTFADTVVTEHGVAQLLGKSIRERAQELISVAHPDFRKDLRKAAEKLYYP
ncbi:MAG: acetyl-CoA hydrolase/transferase family protein, partial [Dehalococcoidia bacterium]